MQKRYDRVVRKEYAESRLVYSIVADEVGLYLIHTGDVRGLVNLKANGHGDPSLLDEKRRFIDELAANEERLTTMPLDMLASKGNSTFIAYGAILSVVARARNQQPTMYLKTEQGDFSFAFTQSTRKQVQELLQTITERK